MALWCFALPAACTAQPQPQPQPQPPQPCMCTQSFAMVTLELVDAAGAPVVDAEVRVRRTRTGASREATADVPGMYTVADDMLRDSVRADAEPFEVTVRRSGRTQRVTVIVGTRQPVPPANPPAPSAPNCRCHVLRISGPQRLVVR